MPAVAAPAGRVAKALFLLLGSGLALGAMANMAQVFVYSPAFNPASRSEGIFGNWQVAVSPALYDRAAYLLQVAHGFVHSDVLVSGVTEASTETAELLVTYERAEEAIGLLRESLALAPADALAWETLAWAHGLNGELEAMMEALAVSRQLAPHNLDLAFSRLSLVRLTADFERDFASLGLPEEDTTIVRGSVETNFTDLEVLRRFAPTYYEDTLASFPELAEAVGEPRQAEPPAAP